MDGRGVPAGQGRDDRRVRPGAGGDPVGFDRSGVGRAGRREGPGDRRDRPGADGGGLHPDPRARGTADRGAGRGLPGAARLRAGPAGPPQDRRPGGEGHPPPEDRARPGRRRSRRGSAGRRGAGSGCSAALDEVGDAVQRPRPAGAPPPMATEYTPGREMATPSPEMAAGQEPWPLATSRAPVARAGGRRPARAVARPVATAPRGRWPGSGQAVADGVTDGGGSARGQRRGAGGDGRAGGRGRVGAGAGACTRRGRSGRWPARSTTRWARTPTRSGSGIDARREWVRGLAEAAVAPGSAGRGGAGVDGGPGAGARRAAPRGRRPLHAARPDRRALRHRGPPRGRGTPGRDRAGAGRDAAAPRHRRAGRRGRHPRRPLGRPGRGASRRCCPRRGGSRCSSARPGPGSPTPSGRLAAGLDRAARRAGHRHLDRRGRHPQPAPRPAWTRINIRGW